MVWKDEGVSREGAERTAGNSRPGTTYGCKLCKGSDKKMKIQDKSGIRLLLERYRAIFRTDENRQYYKEEDYRKAERKFLKYALEQRRIEIQEELFE